MTSNFAYVIKVAPPRLGSVLRPYVKHGATADPRRARKCALHFAAAWGHQGTSVGELAARTSLRGDVEVAHPATYPCFLRAPRRPRACLILYSRA